MKKKGWQIVLALALIGLIASLGFIAWNLYKDMESRETYDDVISQVTDDESDDSSVTLEDLENMEFTGVRKGKETELPSDLFTGRGNPIDFARLKAINPDLYAWIRILDAGIDYPIAQHPSDGEYYLNHDLYGEVAICGCVFTQHYNRKDFSDPNTVIYGHNMADGTSMFASLHQYEDADFFKKVRYCYIYTEDKIRVYDLFATRSFTNDNLMLLYDWKDPHVLEDFLKGIFSESSMESNIREGVEVTGRDRIITLSTCINGQPENRFLIHGKLVWEGNEEELKLAEAEIAARDAKTAAAEQTAPN